MLVVKIQNPATGLSLDTAGILDTGADSCAIPASFANLLGYNLTRGTPVKIGTGNGLTDAYTHICRVDVYDWLRLRVGNTEPIYTTSEIPINFMPNLPFVLLGVDNFLGQFVLSIDYSAQIFSMRA
ncbi:MAG: retroviral-like aspartic protease family protein [Planctomycetaceae bacterium]|nr:retroviral-like aspartic protease family protein [Planctomycetaceae bacterium]